MTTLLVASTGGHLKQLHTLRPRLRNVPEPFVWVTFDTPQSRSLLEDETAEFVHFVGGRDPVNVMRNLLPARRILKRYGAKALVSTGSAVALPFFAQGRLRSLDCHYIESAARAEGPSASGGMVARIPGVNLYTQYPGWADRKWRFRGSVFETFERGPESAQAPVIKRVVVSLGTYKGFEFPLLVQRLIDLLPPDAEVLWQTGDTNTDGLGIEGVHAIPEAMLADAVRDSDLFVAHAGVGSALLALGAGKLPLLVPRRLARGEHIDDHQILIADELSRRGLAVSAEADQLTVSDLEEAARGSIAVASGVAALELDASDS